MIDMNNTGIAYTDLVVAVRTAMLVSVAACEPDEHGSHHMTALLVPVDAATDLIMALARIEGLTPVPQRQYV